MIQGCIFDLDGTIVDSLKDLANATNKVLTSRGFPTHELEKYNYFVGNGVKKLVERALPEDSLDMIDVCLKDFYVEYERCCLENTYSYSGIQELLTELKNNNIRLSVVTNKPHYLATKIVNVLFPDTFVTVLGNQDNYPVKPNPSSTYIALKEMNVDADECLFVGDSNVDIQTGKNANMRTVGVTWGFRTLEELVNEGATYVVNHPSEIGDIIHEDRH